MPRRSMITGVILHEVSHLLLKHHRRAASLLGNATNEQFSRWNVATDYAINSMLREQRIPLWDGMLFPEDAGFKKALSGEEYFRLLTEQANKQQQQQEQDDANEQSESGSGEEGSDLETDSDDSPAGDGGADDDASDSELGNDSDGSGRQDGGDSDVSETDDDCTGEMTDDNQADGDGDAAEAGQDAGDGAGDSSGDDSDAARASGSGNQRPAGMERPAAQPGCGDGGSCSDGRARDWELPAPGDCDAPGIEPHEQDIIIHKTAERIADKTCGDGSGAWQQWANQVINPKVDPRLALLRLVRQAVEVTSGQVDYSYRRPNRRNPRRDICDRPPSNRSASLSSWTSGSMDCRPGAALGLIGEVLNGFRIRDGVQVV